MPLTSSFAASPLNVLTALSAFRLQTEQWELRARPAKARTRTTAPPPLLSQAATADAEATAALVGESDFSSILYYVLLYCPALPAAGTAKARSLQNRSNNLVSRTCLPMSQSPTFWVKSRGCSARWRLSKPPEVTKLPRRWIKRSKIVCHNVEPLLLTFVASVNATATYQVQPLKQKIVPCANVLMGDSWVSLGP